MKKSILTILFVFFAGFLTQVSAEILSVTLTPASPSIVNGSPYYLAGVQYEFRVQVLNPAATGRNEYPDIILEIPLSNTTTIQARWRPIPTDPYGSFTFTGSGFASSGIQQASANNVSGTSNLDLRFRITFAYNIGGDSGLLSIPTSREITVSAGTITPATSDTRALNYGFCSQISLHEFSMDGDAADGMINPHYTSGSFNITGTLIYNIPGAIHNVQGTIGTVTLFEDPNANNLPAANPTGFSTTAGTNNVSISVPYTYFNERALRTYNWRLQVNFTAQAGNQIGSAWTQNPKQLINDRVIITSLTVAHGGGRDSNNYHWRSSSASGVQMIVTARIQNAPGSGGMSGSTTFTINYAGGIEFDITIPNGQNSAAVNIPSASIPSIPINEDISCQYNIVRISGSSYGPQGDGTIGSTTINQGEAQIDTSLASPNLYIGSVYARPIIHWDNGKPPMISTANITSVSTSATYVFMQWSSSIDTSDTSPDGDFYEYRIYYRLSGTEDTFRQWSGSHDPAIRGLTANRFTTITHLRIFSDYDYYLVAADIFGNESPRSTLNTFKTTPYSTEVVVSDGVTTIPNVDFLTGDPAERTFTETNIRITVTIITTGKDPDIVTIWYTNDMSNTPIVLIDGTNQSPNESAFDGNLESAIASKISPNTYVAYLPTTSPIIKHENAIRFVIETKADGISVFSDMDIRTEEHPDPNNSPWTFHIGTKRDLQPPTRILNNVINSRNPIAYPSFYLSDDALVTIKVYDVKGRAVVTLLDKAPRKAGRNILDQGWDGRNKARRNVGPGLYYVHFSAKRTSDNRVILNRTEKVVVAK